ncbi:hypothetical protein M569_02654 [Genlisea aurea]|uniref:Uncharacterized protein n=1 Tax=Genlisea aurea TaxID=192259 RepID=S8EHC4_9LAMI|nr:hypothetical protein M569_02654 [Genlisea aurea]
MAAATVYSNPVSEIMSSSAAGFAEVYAMKKIYKEKTERIEDRKSRGSSENGSKKKSGSGCFSGVPFSFKKIHPGTSDSN